MSLGAWLGPPKSRPGTPGERGKSVVQAGTTLAVTIQRRQADGTLCKLRLHCFVEDLQGFDTEDEVAEFLLELEQVINTTPFRAHILEEVPE